MKRFRIVHAVAAGLACLGMVVPQTALQAAGPQQAKKVVKPAAAVTDVAMQADGTVQGQVLNAQGAHLDGAVVSIRQGNEEVARTLTDAQGRFTVRNLRGGVYHVVAGRGAKVFRFWAPKTAPPSAQAQAVIVSGAEIVRGQGMYALDVVTLTTLGASIAAVTVAAVNNNDINDIQDELALVPKSN